jgi:hypothetical protein
MARRCRRLPLSTIVIFAIVVLAAGCRTGTQKPFHYSVDQGIVTEDDTDVVVAIGEDCRANPERVALDSEATGERGFHDQVIWYVESEQSGDRVVISAKPAEEQAADPAKGRAILELFQPQYEIFALDETPPNNAIRSGRPKKSLLVAKEHFAIWKYNIEYFRDGEKLCDYDPEICIQKPGSDGCGMTN